MSAFFGMVSLDGSPVDVAYLEQMKAYLARIGPDRQEVWSDGVAGMVHAMLKTSGGAVHSSQPFSNGRLTVVGDVRLDQRSILLSALGGRAHAQLSDKQDAELLLLAWEKWGKEALQHIRGDFSAAVWDSEARTLHCLRDQIGIRPFFYARVDGFLLFSNALECLARHSAVFRDLDDNYLLDFLVFGYPTDPEVTVYREVKRLAPAHYLRATPDKLSVHRYWSLPATGEIYYPKLEDYPEYFCELLAESVRDRLPAGEAAVLMSGGLDSTSVASQTHRVGGDDRALGLYTLDTSALWPEDQEARYAAMVAESLGVRHEACKVVSQDLFGRSEYDEWTQPEPVRYSFWPAFLDVTTRMASHGRVGLTGQGGDGLLTPSPMHFNRLLSSLQWARFVADTWKFWHVHQAPPPLGVRSRLKKRYERNPQVSQLPPFLRPEVVARTGLAERYQKALAKDFGDSRSLRPEALADLGSPVWPAIVGRLDPQVTGVPFEFRHPFLDLRLIEMVLRMPAVPWFHNKALLRYAMRGKLPEAVRLRRKSVPRVPPVYSAMRASGGLDVERYLTNLKPVESVIDTSVLERFLRNYGSLKSDEADLVALPVALGDWLASSGKH